MSKYHTHTRHIFKHYDPRSQTTVTLKGMSSLNNIKYWWHSFNGHNIGKRKSLSFKRSKELYQIKETIIEFKCNEHCDSFGERDANENLN